jgi:hypothetical protein
MKITRAIWTGALSWGLVFIEVSILMFVFGIQNTDTSIAHHLLFPVTILIPALIYFNKPEVEKGAKQGIYLCLIFFATSLVLDSIITIPLFVKDYGFLLNPYHLIGLAESLAVTVVVGVIKKK